ncbi:6-phosphogluconolactonase [Rhodococcus sp. TAF43]|uniref:6-phosphogluconolactonase n=1 Tax=unclassified Rhodococcus (in: high G+C Gram-positive bacteria) TaxID=192944 RepID=UPI000E0C63B4|nr:6-phosphogluconolactonase [Rhodococcus sp. AG1013]RDI21852.1 6-phosphogluconolactonase [Rhodococcus sp. AG1013]
MSDVNAQQEIQRYPDTDALVQAAATRFVDAVVAAQRERGSASVVLTGGGTGIALLEHVRKNPGAIDWSALDVFFGDERFLPSGDPERNEVQAHQALLDHVPVDQSRVHVVAASDGAYNSDPVTAAAAYAEVLDAFGSDRTGPLFDIHLLGMGGEGHINSLFPHTDAVRESKQLVVAVTDSPKPPAVRVTLTLPALQSAREVWLIVSGEAKADAVAAAIGGASAEEIPAAGARGIEKTVWLLDETAAGALPRA